MEQESYFKGNVRLLPNHPLNIGFVYIYMSIVLRFYNIIKRIMEIKFIMDFDKIPKSIANRCIHEY